MIPRVALLAFLLLTLAGCSGSDTAQTGSIPPAPPAKASACAGYMQYAPALFKQTFPDLACLDAADGHSYFYSLNGTTVDPNVIPKWYDYAFQRVAAYKHVDVGALPISYKQGLPYIIVVQFMRNERTPPKTGFNVTPYAPDAAAYWCQFYPASCPGGVLWVNGVTAWHGYPAVARIIDVYADQAGGLGHELTHFAYGVNYPADTVCANAPAPNTGLLAADWADHGGPCDPFNKTGAAVRLNTKQ